MQNSPSLDAKQWADSWWRLTHLYYIVDERGVVMKFEPNPEQRDLYDNAWFRDLILKARQLGFTTLITLMALDQCLFVPNFSAGIVAHSLEDVGKIFRNKVAFAYDRLPDAIRDKVPTVKRTGSEMVFSNGSSISVGTSMRGGTLQLLHVSEFGKICRKYPDKAKEIVTGAFETVAAGNRLFVESTAEGNGGYFYEYCMAALRRAMAGTPETPLDFRLHFYPWFRKDAYTLSDADTANVAITDEQLEYFEKVEAINKVVLKPGQRAWYVKKAETLMQEMKREYPSTPEEAFEQAIDGAVLGMQMAKLRKDGRLTSVPLMPAIPVNTFWDLGQGDKTAIWLHQRVNLQNRFVRYTEASGQGMGFFWSWLQRYQQDNNVVWGRHYLPHDGDAGVQGVVVKTRAQILEDLGAKNVDTVPRIREIGTGIDLLRSSFSDVWIDAINCAAGVSALDNYQFEWDDRLGRWRDKPLHNWASDGADAFRQFSQGYTPPRMSSNSKNPRKRSWRTT